MDIGAALKRHRLAQGATLNEVASLSGTDAGNLSRVERNAQNVSFAKLERICAALGYKPSVFIRQVEQWENYQLPGEPDDLVRRLRNLMRMFAELKRDDQADLLRRARRARRIYREQRRAWL